MAVTQTSTARAGRYALLEQLGEGGMGAVYRAKDRASGKVVAFKQLHSAATGHGRRTIEALFEREYHTLVRLKHPRIIEVFEYGLTDLGPYYTMELLDGKDLQQLAPLPVADVCRHLRDVASSLALIHAQRLVHRDVSARNVRLTADGRAKLIDFGALSTFGTATEVAGTPPCMAPEMLRRLPLDQRADLYALGATGYFALTGRYPYRAPRVEDLPRAWQEIPLAPSRLAPGIPEALDTLIMSLLSQDPLARPASAAAVIDQLTAIGGLEPEAHEQAAESYLSSARLVGRSDEQQWLRQKLARALQGKGGEVLIEGPSGIGKTRLLHELCLEAQLRGAIPLRADAQASTRPFGVAAALVLQLLATCPESTRRAAARHAGLLAHLSPEMAEALAPSASVPLAQDPAERRARFQTALHEVFMAVATEHALLVAVDNAQTADDNSAAFVAALGRSSRGHRLLVLYTQTSGDEVVAPIPLGVLGKRSAHLKLAGLGERACEELVTSLFGNVANSGRLARLLYEKSGGNPQQCMDLAQLLVRRKIVEYVDGAFVLPLAFPEGELPTRIDELLQEKLAALRPEARSLCETLSIHAQRVSIERCLALAGLGEHEVYRALDELVAEQILLVDGGHYGFRQQAAREAVLAHVSPERRRALHRAAAEALLRDSGEEVAARMEAGFHLLHAGEEARGADIMAVAARVYLRHQGVESVEQVVRAIETALALYEKQSRSKYQIASMLFPLMSLAFFVDWRVTLAHGERAIALGLDITGLGLAQRLSRYLPDKVALGIGLVVAALRFVPQQLRGLKFNLIEAIEQFCALVPPVVGTQNVVYDLPATLRSTRQLEALKLFGRAHIAALMYDFARAQYLMAYGRERESVELLERLRQQFPDPSIRKVLGELHWKALYGGILFSLGIPYAYEFGERALDVAREMEELDVRVWAMAADEVRMLHHALRGETEDVQRYRERVELFAVQGSTTWQAEIFWPLLLMDGEIRAGDTIAVRTIREQIARRAKDHPSLAVFSEIAHAAYLSLRGEHGAAIKAFEAILERAAVLDRGLAWTTFRGCFHYAQALNSAGEHARAKQYVTELLERAGRELEGLPVHYLEPQRQLALAEAGLQQHAEAVRRLDALLERHGAEPQPLLIGLLHKARAEVALAMEDLAAFEHHAKEAELRFQSTRNPALIAQSERLLKRGTSGRLNSMAPDIARLVSISGLVEQPFSGVSSQTERCELALSLIVQDPRVNAGHLYLLKGDRLELAAASTGEAAPIPLEEQLLRDVRRARQQSLEVQDDRTVAGYLSRHTREGAKSVFIESVVSAEPFTGPEQRHRLIVLSTRRGGRQAIVGGVILELRQACAFSVDLELFEPIASALLSNTSVR